jgi:hypothetical protein
MTDEEVITAVRDQRNRVHMTTPVEQVISRGRAVRARRRIPAVAGALAVAAAVAVLAVTHLAPASHQPSPQRGVQLAAWTVVRQADGTVRVTIREFTDPAGLQSKLRADSIPASVTFIGQENPACQLYPSSPALQRRVFSHTFEYIAPPRQGPPATIPPQAGLVAVLLIHGPALPSGVGVQLASVFTPPSSGVAHATVRADLVYASLSAPAAEPSRR